MSDIDGLLTAYSFTEPYFMLGTVLCEYLGLKPRYCSAMIAGGASPAVMLAHAAAAIATGMANTVLVCTGENRATGLSRDAAVSALAAAVGHPYFEMPYGPSIPGAYAMIAQRYMHEYGLTRDQLAQVAVTTRRHASLHSNSHMQDPITIQDVITSKPIADPLNLLDCCLISDAAGAFIVTSTERARDLNSRPAYLLGVGERHTHEHILAAESLVHFGAAESGRAAYEMAGVGPCDIDVAQLYDCFSIVPVIELEELGFCERGRGWRFLRRRPRGHWWEVASQHARRHAFARPCRCDGWLAGNRRGGDAATRGTGSPPGRRGGGCVGAQRGRRALVTLLRDPREQPWLINNTRKRDQDDCYEPGTVLGRL